MWFGKNIITKLGLVLAMAVPALTWAKASVAPLYFSGASGDAQQEEYWDGLMKYKLWGTEGLTFNKENVHIADSNGFSGTATGDVSFFNGYHHLGGPILAGGNLHLASDNTTPKYDTLSGGPVRVLGGFYLADWAANEGYIVGSFYDGPYCIQGSFSTASSNGGDPGLENWRKMVKGGVYGSISNAEGSYSSCPDSVPAVDTHLSVPIWPKPAASEWSAGISLDQYNTVGYIHVPPESVYKNAYGTYDLYIDKLEMKGTPYTKLYVVMPPGGRLTRIFVKGGFAIDPSANSAVIQVVYVDDKATYTDGKWDVSVLVDSNYVSNDKYAGNLLFYTNEDVDWNSMKNPSYQGTFMTTGKFSIKDHFTLAGQLVAKNLWFESDIIGDFKYMPFDPPWIDINPEARSWGTVYEGISGKQAISVALNEPPKSKSVSFKYCFDFKGDQNKNKDNDSLDAYLASKSDMVLDGMPVCNGAVSTAYDVVEFPQGQTKPTKGIYVEVADDLIEEWTEFFIIRVFDMEGAVLPNKKTEGEFFIEIEDDDKAPHGKDTTFVGIEDEDYIFVKFPAVTGNGSALEDYKIKIESLPKNKTTNKVVGTLTYFGKVIDQDMIDAGLVIEKDSLGKLVYHGEQDDWGDEYAFFSYKVINKDVEAKISNKATIRLEAVNDPLIAHDTLFTIFEHSASGDVADGQIVVDDDDDTRFTFAFDTKDASYAAVKALYVIDEYGRISVKDGVVLDREIKDSVLTIAVLVTDAASTTKGVGAYTDTSSITIRILDLNEKPDIHDTTLAVDENVDAGTQVGKVNAKDEDVWTKFTYSLADTSASGNDPVAKFFTIDANGLISVAEGTKLDFEERSEYTILAIVKDNGESEGFAEEPNGVAKDLYDTAIITIKVNDLNEKPKFEDVKDNYNVDENTPVLDTFATVVVFDPDANDVGNLKVSLTDNKKVDGVVSAEELFDVTLVAPADADSAKKGYAYAKISVKSDIDYEALYDDHYDASKQEVLFDVTLHLKDVKEEEITATTKIFVNDVNERPTAEDGEFEIHENSPANTPVGQVVASDPDAKNPAYGTLHFSFMTVTTQFVIDEATGKITVADGAELDYETTPDHKITLLVVVTDGGTEPQVVTVVVTLLDENEPPKIIDDGKNYEVAEKTAAGTEIARYEIMDDDADDANFATALVVSLTDNVSHSVKADSLFEIVVKTEGGKTYAVLQVKNEPDFEDIFDKNADSLFTVTITLKDRQGADGCITVPLQKEITVRDINEAPNVDDADFDVKENSPKETVVGTLTYGDPDRWAELSFSLVDIPGEGEVAKLFNIDKTGKITVAENAKLDYETKSLYKVKVVVTDNGSSNGFTDLSDDAIVTIHVTDEDEKPGFDDKNPVFAVYENSAANTHVGTVTATDDDCSDNVCAALTYTLVADTAAANAADYAEFKIDAATGEITVAKDSTLNYEVKNLYYALVVVTDGSNLKDTARVRIDIKDANDRPVIQNKDFQVAENADAGTVVDTLKVSDEDTWTKLSYELKDIDPNDKVAQLFNIDSKGVITVAKSGTLDYETRNEYQVWAKVTDNGAEKGFENLSDSVIITIRITDQDEKPHFDDKEPHLYVDENSMKGTKVGDIVAIDDDCKDNVCAALTYKLVADTNAANVDDYNEFVIDASTGRITVAKDSTLNYEVKDLYYALVVVTDGSNLKDTARVAIHINDVNDRPVIENQEFNVVENAKAETVVDTVEASDEDSWAKLSYELKDIDPNDKVAHLFKIDSKGVIKVVKNNSLDYEKRNEYKVWVVVTDNGAEKGFKNLSDSAIITIRVTDENEPPEFIDDGKNYEIAENTPKTTEIARYEINDQDAADANFVKSLVVSLADKNTKHTVLAENLFDIKVEQNAGKTYAVLRVADTLNFEAIMDANKDSVFNVTLTLKDQKGVDNCNVVTLDKKIAVYDVNEKPTVEDVEEDIEENLKNGTTVAEVEARDPDTIHKTEFAQLTYAITTPNMPFGMNGNKVVVTNSSELNYEINPKFEFYVKVTNCEYDSKGKLVAGAVCLEDSAKVTINLTDVDERPKIIIDDPDDPDPDDDNDSLCIAHCDTTNRGSGDHGKDAFTIGVNENVPKGHVVFSYLVYDEDSGDMAQLVPSIVQTNSTVSGKKAEDLFEISKQQVLDDNNNPVLDSLGKPKWRIVVTVKDSLDYEALRDQNAKDSTYKAPQFTVLVIVSEPNGYRKALKDTIIRVIEVRDVNESPLFDVETCVIAENNKVGDIVGRVEHPSDIDSLSKNVDLYDNEFELVGGDTALFDLKKSGPLNISLVAKVAFDCEARDPVADTLLYKCGVDGYYKVTLDYYDETDPSVKLRREVPITLLDVNENPEIKTEVIEVTENAKKGTKIDTIKAEDVDVYDTVLTYSLAEDNSKCFDIGKNTGIVTVKTDKCASLDYEKNTELPIKVKVTDTKGGSDTRTIRVKIKDVNEAPNLDNKTITVKEDTPVGTVVDKVVATDPDKAPEYSDLTYKVIGGDTTMFSIDPKTGEVTLKDTLDYELKAHSYKLIVQVDDHEYTDIATLTINIKNVDEWSDVVITKYENIDSTWNYPDTIYTNQPEGTITWKQDGEIMSVDTTLKKGKNVIVITYKDPTKDYPGKDTIVVMFNDDTPVVTVSAKAVDVKAENVYTIVERTDLAAEDSNIYVNKMKDSIYVTVKDKASKRDTAFAVEISLEPVTIPQATLSKVSDISKKTRPVDDIKLSNEATRISLNGDEIKLTYSEVYGKDTVTVSYVTDKKGEPVKVPVVNAKGKIDSLEIITVSYKTVINGEEVTISYQAEANTGEVLAKGPSGELMVQGASKKSSSKDGKESSSSSSDVVGKMASEGIFTVVSEKADTLGNSTVVSYAIDEKGVMVKNEEGDIGYAVTYTYVNMYGNAASQSVFIVLDQVGPKVEIITPANGSVVRSNYVTVEWTVNGVKQDTLTLQGLEKGANVIVRFFRDKAGNEASDTVFVVMKDSKDVDLAVEEPVTEITKEKVEEYYAINPPEEGQTFAVSVRNPTTGEEKETLIGGKFETKDGSGKEPYPGVKGSKHLGPTLTMDVKLPVINAVGGLATMDDLVSSDGMIPLEGVDAENATKVTVEQYVEDYCEDGFKLNGDLSQVNMYRSKMHVQIWIYTSLGNFVDYYAFTQDLNDPSYTNEAGLLEMYFEMKPDKDGFVKADNGKLYATGSYLYKVEASIRSELRCTLPPVADPTGKKLGDKVKSGDELLKSFGYKRPPNK